MEALGDDRTQNKTLKPKFRHSCKIIFNNPQNVFKDSAEKQKGVFVLVIGVCVCVDPCRNI